MARAMGTSVRLVDPRTPAKHAWHGKNRLNPWTVSYMQQLSQVDKRDARKMRPNVKFAGHAKYGPERFGMGVLQNIHGMEGTCPKAPCRAGRKSTLESLERGNNLEPCRSNPPAKCIKSDKSRTRILLSHVCSITAAAERRASSSMVHVRPLRWIQACERGCPRAWSPAQMRHTES